MLLLLAHCNIEVIVLVSYVSDKMKSLYIETFLKSCSTVFQSFHVMGWNAR